MAILLLTLILCQLICVSNANILPIRTSIISHVPLTTYFPATATPRPYHELIRRATTSSSSTNVGLNFCGWIDGDYESSVTCYSTATCAWNPRNKVVDCYDTTDVLPHFTTCIVNDEVSGCDATCMANPNLLVCKSPNKCYTALYPDGYSGVSCRVNYPATINVALTYGGQPTPVRLPHILGEDGGITAGTQLPLGYSTGGVQISEVSSASSESGTATSSGAPASKGSTTQKTNLGAILGGSIGGGMFILAICIGIFIWARVRAKRMALSVPTQYRPVKKHDLGEQEMLGGKSVQELDGRAATAYELNGQ